MSSDVRSAFSAGYASPCWAATRKPLLKAQEVGNMLYGMQA
jgi:hypothetical protein